MTYFRYPLFTLLKQKTSEANASEVLLPNYQLLITNLRISPLCAILAVFDGDVEFLQLVADLI